ncbi:type I DNA topoisomerase [bacterium]|nr:type I DNA topoisomerase [bacterium]
MKKKSLIIVESPAKCRTISKYLDSSFKVMASKGHVRDLPEDEFGVNLKDDFTPKYVLIKGKKSIVDTLKRATKSVDQIFLAMDPDREGEAIAWHISKVIETDSRELYRVLFNEITKKAVTYGISNPTQIDTRKVYAQQARRILDRLVGYLVSPILWKTYYSGLSAGRVQSVALRLICERQDEINQFDPREFWKIFVFFALPSREKERFKTRLVKKEGTVLEIPNQKEAETHLKAIRLIKEFKVLNIEKKQRLRNPPAPFITSSLQHDAVKFLRFSTMKTMKIAQTLYEGVELGTKGPMGLITYMRTDSTRIAQEALDEAYQYITATYGAEYATTKKYKPGKGAQDAHEAIRPTSMENTPESVKPYLDNNQFRLYQLIWRRFIASQMKPAKLEATIVTINGEKYEFEAQALKTLFDGFTKVYSNNGGESKPDGVLPELEVNQVLQFLDAEPEQNFTQPPPQFNEGTIVKELESNGIGRPSTYAQIISTLIGRNYIKRESGKLVPTEIGMEINGLLVKVFPDIFDVKFTANLEEKLDEVESGKRNWVSLLKKFYTSFKPLLDSVREHQQELKKQTETPTDYVCEECGAPMVIKWGKYGRFLACSAFPKCQNAKPLPTDLGGEEESHSISKKCPKCGSNLVVKYSKQNRRFIACEAYPKCKYTEPYNSGVKCPKPDCPGTLVERYSKRGRQFYGCSEYPNCKFASWDEPVNEVCPECGAIAIFKKDSPTKLKFYCANCSWSEEHTKNENS